MTIWVPFSATIRQEENFYISICPEADIICKGNTIEEAIENLKEEVEKFLGEELSQGFSKIAFYGI
jgi:predicted RNase H-like HicB family nuclease